MQQNTESDLEQVELNRDLFLRELVRELTGTLEEVVGLEEASGYISLVGQRIGERLNAEYRQALNLKKLDRAQVADVLVKLKHAIQGNFSIVKVDQKSIVLQNTACPFAEHVKDRPSLCMMTSNVFGTITADNLGYAQVGLEKTIAAGDSRCKIVISLEPTVGSEVRAGREYFGNPS